MSGSSDLKELSTSNYFFTFPFEADFDPNQKREWMVQHRHEAFYYVGIYVLLIFGVKAYMKDRPKMELQRTVAVWNIIVAVFSIMGVCRTFPELYYVLRKFGFAHSVCDPNFISSDKVTAFWAWMFAISKLPEFADTLFILLRKHQLIFLHWYHHITVVLFCWYCYSEHVAAMRWFVAINYFAHSLMYTYYALRVMRISLPRSFAISLTSVQIIQMVIGLCVTYSGYVANREGRYCRFPYYLTIWVMFLFASYLILFVWFFYCTYLTPKRKNDKSQ